MVGRSIIEIVQVGFRSKVVEVWYDTHLTRTAQSEQELGYRPNRPTARRDMVVHASLPVTFAMQVKESLFRRITRSQMNGQKFACTYRVGTRHQ